jgi:transcriptional antiterminator NusG
MVLTDDSWYIVRNTRGVTGFVGPGSKPVPLSEKEVEALGVDTGAQSVQTNIQVGDDVMMVGGSFDGMSGTVSGIDLEAKTADVTVSMFGRETAVTLPLTQVRKED